MLHKTNKVNMHIYFDASFHIMQNNFSLENSLFNNLVISLSWKTLEID